MEEQKFIQLLQYYRHDLMNELQVIKGYLSMDKMDKVNDKVEDIITYYNEERKLMGTKATMFILWIIEKTNMQDNIRLSYQINIENMDLSTIDLLLVDQCKQLIHFVRTFGEQQKIHEINLQLNKRSSNTIELIVLINSHMKDQMYLEEWVNNMGEETSLHIKESDSGTLCEWIFSMKV